jgi:Sulfotransferase family
MAARERLGPERFLDVHHGEFTAAPMAVLERIYDWLGLELSGDTRSRFERWRAESHVASHHYTAAEFGLSAEAIREQYDAYLRRFGVEIEKARTRA